MSKKGLLLMAVMVMVLIGAGCSPINETENWSRIKLIIVTNDALSADEITQKISEVLKPQDQNMAVYDVEMSEENKYLVTTGTKLTEDEVVSVLENADWIKTVEINYELKMY